jgi:hypothetical protein
VGSLGFSVAEEIFNLILTKATKCVSHPGWTGLGNEYMARFNVVFSDHSEDLRHVLGIFHLKRIHS